jgi:hypothetical protein
VIPKKVLSIPPIADREVEDGFFFAREGDLTKLSEYIEGTTASIDDRNEQVRQSDCTRRLVA